MRALAFVSLILPALAAAAPPDDQWFTVLLDGRKIGSFESRREVLDGEVRTTQALEVTLDRADARVSIGSTETSIETADGRALAFSSISRLSGIESRTDGKLHDGRAEVTTTIAGVAQTRTIPWPSGALLAEGQRLAALRAGIAAGTRFDVLAFQPSNAEATRVDSTVVGAESVALPAGSRRLHRIDQTIAFPGAPMKTRTWVDDEQTAYKVSMPIMGVDLVMLACDRACANAPNQGSDVFERTLMSSPRALGRDELAHPMRYTLASKDGTLALPQTDEQRVEARGAQNVVTIDPHATTRSRERPSPADFKPNDWLQSEAPDVVALARKAVGDASAPSERMGRIERFVRGYIRNKTLDVGYASALEVVHKPEGDCTEHAILVAALGRALGIATRVVDGLAYAPGFAGKDQVFVPHAWAQAFVDGRWRSFDAALPGFDAGHIVLAVGDGDPWKFYAGLDLLGRIELRAAEPATP